MTNLERLNLEIQDIDYTSEELTIFLAENELIAEEDYDPTSNTSKRNIYRTALSILEAIANNPKLMRNYKSEDMTITDFADSLQNRIQMLDRKIRMLPTDDTKDSSDSSFVYMFRH